MTFCNRLLKRGLAYKMIRKGDTLYISGMGAPNRVLRDESYKLLAHAQHMFRDVNVVDEKVEYFSSMRNYAGIEKRNPLEGFFSPSIFLDRNHQLVLLSLFFVKFFSLKSFLLV